MRRVKVPPGRHFRTPRPRGRARNAWYRAGLAVICTVALPAVLLLGWWSSQGQSQPLPQSAPATSQGSSAPVAVPAAPTPAGSRQESPPAASPGDSTQAAGSPSGTPQEATAGGAGRPPLHINYAAVEMDQAVLPLAPTELEIERGWIVPPATTDAYWLTPYGSPGSGSTNTTYVIGHSWEGRPSPFNNVSTRSKPGDQFTVTTAEGPLDYRIDAITTEYKDTLKDSAIWDIVPGRLVLITCFTEDLWGKNIIIQASPVPAP